MSIRKLKPYKQQLLDLMTGSGWELLTIEEVPDWWFTEHWTLQSVRHRGGYEIVISFIDAPVSRGMQAATRQPRDHLDGEAVIAKMTMGEGLYNEKLLAFVQEINYHRDGLALHD